MKMKSAFAASSTFLLAGIVLVSSSAYGAPPQAQKKSPGNNAASAKTGCALLPMSLLQATLGETFDEPMEGKMPPAYDGAWGTTCKFSSKPPFAKGHQTTVEFIVFVEASPAAAKQTFEQTAAYFTDPSKPKPGIGDASYWARAKPDQPRMAVLKGKAHFSLSLLPKNEDQLKTLATAVAAQF